jgi:hypothetical protein
MISEYINPRQALGDLFLAAVKDPSLKLIQPETGERLTDGQRSSNLSTILQYAARFVTALEVKDNPLFSLQYIDNFYIITRTILNRDLRSSEDYVSAQQHFDAMFSLVSPDTSQTDFHQIIGSTINSSEESFGKSSVTVTDKQITPDLRDLIEMGYAILWGSYRISEGKRFSLAMSVMSQSVKGALRGALASKNYTGILGGAIAHALIALNFDSRQSQAIFSSQDSEAGEG